jgi:hypothetical protein
LNQKLLKIKKDLTAIQQLRDQLNTFRKLIAVRCLHNGKPLETTQINSIDLLMTQVDIRRVNIELEKQKIKGSYFKL